MQVENRDTKARFAGLVPPKDERRRSSIADVGSNRRRFALECESQVRASLERQPAHPFL